MTRLVALAATAALAFPALAADVSSGELTLKNPVVRAVGPGVPTTAGYVTIVNAGAKADKLVSVSCACAQRVELHVSHVMDGKAMMMPSGPVDIPAHGQAVFGPGALHLMLVGLKAPLKEGGSVPLVLKFQRAGQVKADFAAVARIPLQGAAPAMGGMSMHR